jgi:hypothetical protein
MPGPPFRFDAWRPRSGIGPSRGKRESIARGTDRKASKLITLATGRRFLPARLAGFASVTLALAGVAAGLFSLTGCGEKKIEATAAAPIDTGPKQATYKPTGARAPAFMSETPTRKLGRGTDVLVEAVTVQLGRVGVPAPNHDTNLSALAEELAEYVRATGTVPAGEVLGFAARHVGVADLDLRYKVMVFEDGPDAPKASIETAQFIQQKFAAEPPTHLGAAWLDDRRKGNFTVYVWTRRAAFLKPVARAQQAGSSLTLQGRIYREGVEVRVTALAEGAAATPVPVPLMDKGLFQHRLTVPEGANPRVVVSLVENGSERPHFVFALDTASAMPEALSYWPDEVLIERERGLSPADLAAAAVQVLNRERANAGLPPLAGLGVQQDKAIQVLASWARKGFANASDMSAAGVSASFVRPVIIRGRTVERAIASAWVNSGLATALLDTRVNACAAYIEPADTSKPNATATLVLVLVGLPEAVSMR